MIPILSFVLHIITNDNIYNIISINNIINNINNILIIIIILLFYYFNPLKLCMDFIYDIFSNYFIVI